MRGGVGVYLIKDDLRTSTREMDMILKAQIDTFSVQKVEDAEWIEIKIVSCSEKKRLFSKREVKWSRIFIEPKQEHIWFWFLKESRLALAFELQ